MIAKIKNKKLIIKRIYDLQNKVRQAISHSDFTLTQTYTMEYTTIVVGAIQTWKLKQLKEEFHTDNDVQTLSDSKSRAGSLGILKWIDNSLSKLNIVLTNLAPINEENIELDLRVVDVSQKLFNDGHYAQAIFEAFKALEAYVKEKTGIQDKYGIKLMGHVFDQDRPILKIKCSKPETAKEEQEGFKFLFMGAMLGIRDPKAHHTIIQQDKSRSLRYLTLASLLFEIVDDASVSL